MCVCVCVSFRFYCRVVECTAIDLYKCAQCSLCAPCVCTSALLNSYVLCGFCYFIIICVVEATLRMIIKKLIVII